MDLIPLSAPLVPTLSIHQHLSMNLSVYWQSHMSSSLALQCSQACLGLSSADWRVRADTMCPSYHFKKGWGVPEMEVSTGIMFFASLNSIPRDSLHVEH